MGQITEHIARQARPCDDYPRCRNGLVPGQRYRRYVAFPGQDGNEEGRKPLVYKICARCAAKNFQPITGARIESYKLYFGEPVVQAAGIITETRYRGGAVVGYVITDDRGSVHEVDSHRINVLEPVASVPNLTTETVS